MSGPESSSVGGVFPALGWPWGVLNPVGAMDLTVGVADEVFIALPKEGVDSLSLVHGEDHFQSAMLFTAIVANTGKSTVGSKEHRWKVQLSHPKGHRLAVLSELTATTAALKQDARLEAADGRVSLDVGTFNAGDEIRVKLLAPNHDNEFAYPIGAELSRIDGLSKAEVRRGSISEALHTRIRDRVIPPAWLLWLVLAIVAAAVERRATSPDERANLGGTAVAIAFASALMAWATGWLVGWLGVFVLRVV